MNYIGGAIPASYGGVKISNVKLTTRIPSPDEMKVSSNILEFCTKLLAQPDNKFKGMEDCTIAQRIAIISDMVVGGVQSFDYVTPTKTTHFTACLKRDYDRKRSYFSGYYGEVNADSYCGAPEWYWMTSNKKQNKKGTVGGSGAISITVAGPNYK
jgi:hypothetical protein